MSNHPNINLYLQLFRGREDIFAQQEEDRYFPIQRTLNEFYVRQHLEGNATFGLYVLNQASHCYLVCIDIDIPKSDFRYIDFKYSEVKYGYLKPKLDAVLEALVGQLGVPPEAILLEDTGGRGYHIWVFFSEAVPGQIAVAFGNALKRLLDFEVEVFPKQSRLTTNRKYGNLIKLPLGLHRKYDSWSFFFTLPTEGLHPIEGKQENITLLESIMPVAPEVINEAAKAFAEELPMLVEFAYPTSISLDQIRPQFEGSPAQLVSQCTAICNLRTKAEHGNRLSHSEAFYFADVMLSVPRGAEFIHDTMRLSLKGDYDKNRTQDEIERITPLFPPNCLTLVKNGICPDYCKESVRERNEDSLVSNTTPCSVWFKRLPTKLFADTENFLEIIGTVDNLKRAFFQLKYYHEYEDSLFFDTFDFEHYESRLDANSEVLAKALIEKIEFQYTQYLPVSVPKGLDDEQKLEYRRMSYSTVYDQVPIQAIFNVVSPIVESEFQSTSYGYRWNADASTPYRIFEDWKVAYPRFRNDILAALKMCSNGFHVCCDIKGYYDHVDHNILLEQIRRIVPDVHIFQMIERIVRLYEFESTKSGGRGLPQGPAYSRLLANLYLNEFDIFAKQLSKAYFRYVDDFVLIFENERDAELGLERIVRRLKGQGLELSHDETKKATITPNTDISLVRKTLDKIHYGILEGTRHVQHLVPEAVVDFWDAVERHSASPITLEQLIKINDVLPSLLYVVTQESMFPHPLKPKVLDIVEFLIQHHWFYPKRLKTIFYRLLDMESDSDRLSQLFLYMEPIHKVYFLLSVFGCWQSNDQHRQLLKSLISNSLTDNNEYVLGFAVAIAGKIGVPLDSVIDSHEFMRKISKTEVFFGLLKWLPTIDYLAQPDNKREAIRVLVGPRSPDLLKLLLLANLSHLPTVYVDGVYLHGLIQDSGILLLPAVCELLVSATDKGEVFDSLLEFALSRLAFKHLVISLVKKGIFNRRSTSGLAEIENLRSLYDHVPDEEMKQAMQSALSRIKQYGLKYDKEFAKRHKLIESYNECYLYEMVGEEARYDYLELIPDRMLRNYIHCDLDTFRAIVDDFGANAIMPVTNFVYDSGGHEVRLEFKTDRRYRVLDPNEFSFTSESIRRTCILAVEVYRKACYFQRFTGKAPRISPENLLIDTSTNTVVFRSIGRSLSAIHFFEGTTFGDEESDIAKMISMLLENLMFKSKAEATEFLEEKNYSGLRAFLALFIQRMGAKNPSLRYTCSRFTYLVDQMSRWSKSEVTQDWLVMIYLRERLKGAMFRYNSETITWNGICRALNEHLSEHIRVVCNREALRAFPFRSRVLLAGQGKRQLHTLSRHLLELALSRDDFPDAESVDAAYLDLVEFLLLYALICVEIVAQGRSLQNIQALQCLSASPIMLQDRVNIWTSYYEKDFATVDLAALLIQESEEKVGEAITGLSLRQIAIQCLLACEIDFHDDSIEVKKPKMMSDEVFHKLAHACLVRIPNIEDAAKRELHEVLLALWSNDDFTRMDGLEQIRNDVEILTHDLNKIRKGFHLSRHHGRADGRYFPPKTLCKSLFRRKRLVKEYALPGCWLTNNFPSSRNGYASSWDLLNTTVTNLVIPSEGVNSLMEDLKKGKLFGFKVSFIYSGRIMILWDGVAFIVTGILLAICENLKDSATASAGVKGVCSVFTYILGFLVVALIGKVVLHDLGHWVPWHQRFVNHIQKTFVGDKEYTAS